MAAMFGPGGPIILPWTVRGDRFSGGTVHGVTSLPVKGFIQDFFWGGGGGGGGGEAQRSDCACGFA